MRPEVRTYFANIYRDQLANGLIELVTETMQLHLLAGDTVKEAREQGYAYAMAITYERRPEFPDSTARDIAAVCVLHACVTLDLVVTTDAKEHLDWLASTQLEDIQRDNQGANVGQTRDTERDLVDRT